MLIELLTVMSLAYGQLVIKPTVPDEYDLTIYSGAEYVIEQIKYEGFMTQGATIMPAYCIEQKIINKSSGVGISHFYPPQRQCWNDQTKRDEVYKNNEK